MLGGSDSARLRDEGVGVSSSRTECPHELNSRPTDDPAGPPPRTMASKNARSATGIAASLVAAARGIQRCLSDRAQRLSATRM